MTGESVREEATTRALDALPADAWRLMGDVRCPARRVANIDHIVVGRAGVFVIDSRDWSGHLEVHEQMLTQDGSNRDATIDRVADAALGVAEVVLDLDPRLVVPVLCFDRDEPVSGWVHGVLVCTTGNLVEQLTSQRRVWERAEADQVFERLLVGAAAGHLPRPRTERSLAQGAPPRGASPHTRAATATKVGAACPHAPGPPDDALGARRADRHHLLPGDDPVDQVRDVAGRVDLSFGCGVVSRRSLALAPQPPRECSPGRACRSELWLRGGFETLAGARSSTTEKALAPQPPRKRSLLNHRRSGQPVLAAQPPKGHTSPCS